MASKKPRRDIHAEFTQTIIDAIEGTTDKWEMPWHRSHVSGLPGNATTGNHYNGVNILSLWCATSSSGYTSSQWASYKQWASVGAQVRKGEKGSLVVFYKQLQHEGMNSKGETVERSFMMARASSVFNADQVDDWKGAADPVELVDETERLARADALIAASGADIRHGGEAAYYQPTTDAVHVPNRDRFKATERSSATENYYSTMFHELTHWTGPESRCNRTFGKRFGDDAYAVEELVADLGAAFLCGDLGIVASPRDDHAKYLNHWLKVLKADSRAIFTAASKASAAIKYLNEREAMKIAA